MGFVFYNMQDAWIGVLSEEVVFGQYIHGGYGVEGKGVFKY